MDEAENTMKVSGWTTMRVPVSVRNAIRGWCNRHGGIKLQNGLPILFAGWDLLSPQQQEEAKRANPDESSVSPLVPLEAAEDPREVAAQAQLAVAQLQLQLTTDLRDGKWNEHVAVRNACRLILGYLQKLDASAAEQHRAESESATVTA